jgi:hypothetical protein
MASTMPQGWREVVEDTAPVPSRDELRYLLEQMRTREVRDHMKEWSGMASGKVQGTLSIGRFARIFKLQHYFRAFHLRHAESRNRRMDEIQDAFASYFKVSKRTVRDDMTEIAARIGENWYTSMCLVEAG